MVLKKKKKDVNYLYNSIKEINDSQHAFKKSFKLKNSPNVVTHSY